MVFVSLEFQSSIYIQDNHGTMSLVWQVLKVEQEYFHLQDMMIDFTKTSLIKLIIKELYGSL